MALLVLYHVRWFPECSNPQQINVSKLLPPAFTRNRLYLRNGGVIQWGNEGDCCGSGTRKNVLNARVGASGIDKIGMTACLITSAQSAMLTCLYIQGRIMSEELPVFLEEAAALHVLRALHGWPRNPQGVVETYDGDDMRAGNENAQVFSN